MATETKDVSHKIPAPPIYVVSGNVGGVGEHVVRSILAQFQEIEVPVVIMPRVSHADQVEQIVSQAVESGATIVHTMVDSTVRHCLDQIARERGVFAVDIFGSLMEHLAEWLGHEPVGVPGLYRQLNQAYFQRIAAIEYTMAHDDGMRHETWHEAEIVLIGVSRIGKTPLSIYLSMQGWKVANIPLVPGIAPHDELFTLDKDRVIGLKIAPEQLLQHRRYRRSRLGLGKQSGYVDPITIYDELEEARRVFRQGGFRVLDVTDKPIETSSGQVIEMIHQAQNRPLPPTTPLDF